MNSQGAPATPPPQQGSKTPDPELRGQWLRAGQGFACKVEAGKRVAAPDPDVLSFACQRMGALGVGISEASLKSVLGEPHRKLPPANDATTYVYFLGKPDQYPYLAATVNANRVVALQISGEAPTGAYSFNQINLGDSTEKLLAQFGSPFHAGRPERARKDRALDLRALAFLIRGAGRSRHLDPDQRSDRRGKVDSIARVPITPATAPGDP